MTVGGDNSAAHRLVHRRERADEASSAPANAVEQTTATNVDRLLRTPDEPVNLDCSTEEALDRVSKFAMNVANSKPTNGDDAAEQSGKDPEFSDGWWDMLQLTRLAMANGALDTRVHRHPFQRYIALSYVWGSVENPAYVTIEGKQRLHVTRNLFNAQRPTPGESK